LSVDIKLLGRQNMEMTVDFKIWHDKQWHEDENESNQSPEGRNTLGIMSQLLLPSALHSVSKLADLAQAHHLNCLIEITLESCDRYSAVFRFEISFFYS
jgi:hypothetical protein